MIKQREATTHRELMVFFFFWWKYFPYLKQLRETRDDAFATQDKELALLYINLRYKTDSLFSASLLGYCAAVVATGGIVSAAWILLLR